MKNNQLHTGQLHSHASWHWIFSYNATQSRPCSARTSNFCSDKIQKQWASIWEGNVTPTLTTSSKHEVLGIFFAHSVNGINLLQGLSNCIFILSITWHIRSPELQNKNRHVSLCLHKQRWEVQQQLQVQLLQSVFLNIRTWVFLSPHTFDFFFSFDIQRKVLYFLLITCSHNPIFVKS